MGESENAYWAGRFDLIYYSVARSVVRGISTDAKSIIDVGSAGCPYLDWFSHIPERTSLDLRRPYQAPGVQSIKSDFLKWEPDKRYDIATCFQVMEHVPDCYSFAKKLLAIADVVVISVPYKWPAGKVSTHVQDPVDEYKVYNWFRRHPNFHYVCTEVATPQSRLIHVYDKIKEPWPSLSRRNEFLRNHEKRQQRKTLSEESKLSVGAGRVD